MASIKSGRRRKGHKDPVDQEADTPTQVERSGDRKPPKPSQLRNFTREAVAESMPTIVDAFVDEAKKGSVSHLNLLSKLAGFDQKAVPAPSKRRGKSFAYRLLDNMKEHEAKMIAVRDAAERKSGKGPTTSR
jgi:hypothetical protein